MIDQYFGFHPTTGEKITGDSANLLKWKDNNITTIYRERSLWDTKTKRVDVEIFVAVCPEYTKEWNGYGIAPMAA